MPAPGQSVASFEAAWNTSGTSHLMEATMSMPRHIRCEGSISAPTLVAPVASTSRFRVAGDKARLWGCISMTTRTSLSRASASIFFQNTTAPRW